MTVGLVGLLIGLVLAACAGSVAVGAAAASRLELSRWVSARARGAEIATALLSAPGPVIGTASGIATVGVLLAACAVPAVLAGFPAATATAAAVAVGLPVLLLAGYVIPRAAGRRWAESVVRLASPWLEAASRLVVRVVPGAPHEARADFARIVREPEHGAATREELAVVAGVLAFTERPVHDVMTPRTEIVAVQDGASVQTAATMFAESGYSRLPVYRDSLDNIIGLVYAFDLLKVGADASLPLRPVTLVPGAKRCADLLFEMQRERRQFAVVLDEFGGTAGIVTFEDLLEELVGEIFDEHDGALPPGATGVRLLEVPGTTSVRDLATRFDVALPEHTETVGGLLAAALGRIPRMGERVLLAGLEFDILAATATRVERVVVRRAPVASITAAPPPRRAP